MAKLPNDVFQLLVDCKMRFDEMEPIENLECWSMDPDCPSDIYEYYRFRLNLNNTVKAYYPKSID
jgi:hypothetical protein